MSKPSYRQLNQQIEDLLAQLQSPDLDVDMAAQLYGEAIKVLDRLEKLLEKRKLEIKRLDGHLPPDRLPKEHR